MRIDVKKFLFAGPFAEKTLFFKKAQELGIIHFTDMEKRVKEVPHDTAVLAQAIKILSHVLPLEQEELDLREKENRTFALNTANEILQAEEEIQKGQEELRMLKLEIERVRVYGDFSKQDVEVLEKEGKRKIQFFYAKQGVFENSELPDGLVFIAREHNLDYFVAVNPEKKAYEHMIEMQIEEPIGILLQKKADLIEKIESREDQLNAYAKYRDCLHKALIYQLNEYHLEAAIDSAKMELNGELYFAEGFVPLDKMGQMEELVQNMHVYAEEIAINEEETIPTYLQNEGVNRVGEDLVHIYDAPSHTDKDPSLWVLLSFALFFSMIIGDAGYGLVFLATALYIRYKTGVLKGFKKRMWNLFFILSIACIAWGTMAHSFFGIEMSAKTPFHKISLLNWLAEKKAEYYLNEKGEHYQEWVVKYPELKNAKTGSDVLENSITVMDGKEKYEVVSDLNDGIMLELALLVGIIHVTISFLRYLSRNWSGIGWILFMWGCYLYFPSYLHTISMTNYIFGISVEEAATGGLVLIYLGIFLALFLAVLKHKLYGLLEAMNLIQVFGDILSYLRIYALGLAGAIVMATINEFAWSMNFILGTLLFVVGHLVNMTLGIMGGVIHGLRLNFIEWYHYSFEGGGKMFNPLRKESIE